MLQYKEGHKWKGGWVWRHIRPCPNYVHNVYANTVPHAEEIHLDSAWVFLHMEKIAAVSAEASLVITFLSEIRLCNASNKHTLLTGWF